MNQILKQNKLILASKSPRRKQLLKEAGFDFELILQEVDESYPPTLEPNTIPEFIARKKAKACLAIMPVNSVLVAADCIVLFEGKILEKPKDTEEARIMLSQMSGKEHLVISGVCLVYKSKEISFSVTTKVKFGKLSSNEIEYYIRTYQPFDKAGSYGIQEWLGHCKVVRIEGSYTNVMGLPMYELYHNLISLLKD